MSWFVRPPLSSAPPHTTTWASKRRRSLMSASRAGTKGQGQRGGIEGDLRAEVLKLFVDALQGHCDESMWYLRGWWEIDLGSRLVADWRQYLRRCSPDRSGHGMAERRHSREKKESKDPRRTMETMQGDRPQVQNTGERFYMIVVAQALMAVLCRSRRVCMSKWRGWKGREEKGTVIGRRW